MTSRRRSVIALLVTGIVGLIAFGASASASTNTTNTTTLGIRAFVDNGFDGAVVGVPGAAVALSCSSGDTTLALVGTASNGRAKGNYTNEGSDSLTGSVNEDTVSWSADDLDNTDTRLMNDGQIGDEVSGNAEFVNGNVNRTLTTQYSTEDQPDNSTADCAVWGSAIKGIG
jgi:hypothetical protein